MPSDRFGDDIAISGDTIAINAPYQDYDELGIVSASNAGAVYLFTKSGSSWIPAKKITSPNPGVNIAFGVGIDISGSTLAVGGAAQNSVYIFTGSGSAWNLAQQLVSSDLRPGDGFGNSLQIKDDTLVIGALKQDYDSANMNFSFDAGAAYVFKRVGSTWEQTQKLTGEWSNPNGRISQDHFGAYIDFDNNTLAIGAHHQDWDDIGGSEMNAAGALYEFKSASGNWTFERKIVEPPLPVQYGRNAADVLGAVSVLGNTIFGGAGGQDFDDNPSATDPEFNEAGAVWIFEEPAGNCCAQDSDCDNGSYCDGIETCVNNQCVNGTVPCSDDGAFCNGTESCDEPSDQCLHSGDPCPGQICDEQNDQCTPTCTVCDINGDGQISPMDLSRLENIVNQAPPLPTPEELCAADVNGSGSVDQMDIMDWQSGNVCTFTVECIQDSECVDNNLCNGDETCEAGQCVPGFPFSCRPAPCYECGCDPQTGPYSQPLADGTSCEDADLCNGSEMCQAGACQAGSSLSCDDGNACTADSCDPEFGCTHVPIPNCTSCETNEDCSDNNVCSGIEICESGVCIPGTPLSCDDNNICNGVETCDAALGCQAGTPLSCNDSNVCNGTETCDSVLGCQAGTPLSCNDNNACNGTESCDTVLGCQNGTPLTCDDGLFCNGQEACSAVSGCQDGPDPCPGTCNETTDTCGIPGALEVTPIKTSTMISDGQTENYPSYTFQASNSVPNSAPVTYEVRATVPWLTVTSPTGIGGPIHNPDTQNVSIAVNNQSVSLQIGTYQTDILFHDIENDTSILKTVQLIVSPIVQLSQGESFHRKKLILAFQDRIGNPVVMGTPGDDTCVMFRTIGRHHQNGTYEAIDCGADGNFSDCDDKRMTGPIWVDDSTPFFNGTPPSEIRPQIHLQPKFIADGSQIKGYVPNVVFTTASCLNENDIAYYNYAVTLDCEAYQNRAVDSIATYRVDRDPMQTAGLQPGDYNVDISNLTLGENFFEAGGPPRIAPLYPNEPAKDTMCYPVSLEGGDSGPDFKLAWVNPNLPLSELNDYAAYHWGFPSNKNLPITPSSYHIFVGNSRLGPTNQNNAGCSPIQCDDEWGWWANEAPFGQSNMGQCPANTSNKSCGTFQGQIYIDPMRAHTTITDPSFRPNFPFKFHISALRDGGSNYLDVWMVHEVLGISKVDRHEADCQNYDQIRVRDVGRCYSAENTRPCGAADFCPCNPETQDSCSTYINVGCNTTTGEGCNIYEPTAHGCHPGTPPIPGVGICMVHSGLNMPNFTPYPQDGKLCTANDACLVGSSSFNVSTSGPISCEDGDNNTFDSCDPIVGTCQHQPIIMNDDSPVCGDGSLCSLDSCDVNTDQCDHSFSSCDDFNPCTDDSCDPLTGGCSHTVRPNGSACDDSSLCTLNDLCQAGECTGTPKDCSDGATCSVDSCDPTNGNCEHTPDHMQCAGWDSMGPCAIMALCNPGDYYADPTTGCGGEQVETILSPGSQCIFEGDQDRCDAGEICDNACQCQTLCGNGVLDYGEQCDKSVGMENWGYRAWVGGHYFKCTDDCKPCESCGNGSVEPLLMEQCESGDSPEVCSDCRRHCSGGAPNGAIDGGDVCGLDYECEQTGLPCPAGVQPGELCSSGEECDAETPDQGLNACVALYGPNVPGVHSTGCMNNSNLSPYDSACWCSTQDYPQPEPPGTPPNCAVPEIVEHRRWLPPSLTDGCKWGCAEVVTTICRQSTPQDPCQGCKDLWENTSGAILIPGQQRTYYLPVDPNGNSTTAGCGAEPPRDEA